MYTIVRNRMELDADDKALRMATVLKATEHYLIGPAFEEMRMVKLPAGYANASPETALWDNGSSISPRRAR